MIPSYEKPPTKSAPGEDVAESGEIVTHVEVAKAKFASIDMAGANDPSDWTCRALSYVHVVVEVILLKSRRRREYCEYIKKSKKGQGSLFTASAREGEKWLYAPLL
jgi:hypothetical protein